MKLKIRIYAIYQFLSFLAISSLMISIIVLVSAKGTKMDSSELLSSLGKAISFKYHSTEGSIATLWVYISISTLITTWILGWATFLDKNRNFADSMFILFLMIPLLSNIFCLIAQLSLKTIITTSSKLDKEELEAEKTQIIEIVSQMENAKTERQIKSIAKKVYNAPEITTRENNGDGEIVVKKIVDTKKANNDAAQKKDEKDVKPKNKITKKRDKIVAKVKATVKKSLKSNNNKTK